MYFVLAFWVAALIQRLSGELSLFHQHVVGLLALLSWSSGLLTQISAHHVDAQPGDNKHHALHFTLAALGLIASIVTVSLTMTVRSCQPFELAPSQGFDQLAWIFFGRHLRGAQIHVATAFSLVAVILPALPGVVLYLGALSPSLWGLPRLWVCFYPIGIVLFNTSRVLFLLVWISVVVGIEKSLSMDVNPGLVGLEDEGRWGFGQVRFTSNIIAGKVRTHFETQGNGVGPAASVGRECLGRVADTSTTARTELILDSSFAGKPGSDRISELVGCKNTWNETSLHNSIREKDLVSGFRVVEI